MFEDLFATESLSEGSPMVRDLDDFLGARRQKRNSKNLWTSSIATVRRYGTVNKENLAKISWAVLRG